MKKRIIAAFMAAIMTAGLATGCGSASGSGVAGDQAATSTATEGEAAQGETQEGETQEAGAIDFSEDPYEVKIEVMTLGEDMPDTTAVEEAVNKIALEKVNCTVKIEHIHIGEYPTKMALAAAGGEKVDLMSTGRTYALSSMVSDGVLLPLDDLLQQYGQELYEKAKDLLKAEQFGGKTYSVPGGTLYNFSSYGIIYNKEMADDMGLEIADHVTVEELEEIAKKVKEYDPGLTLFSKGDGSSDQLFTLAYQNLKPASSSVNYGVYEADDDTYTLFNPYASEDYLEYVKSCREWYENEWVPTDSMVSGVNARDVFRSGQSFCELSTCSPLQIGIEAPNVTFELGMSYITDPEVTSTSVQENGWGIYANCERPDKVMQFMNLMYTDEEVCNLLANGIEGTHYEKVSDRIIKYPDGVDSTNIGYKKDFANFGDIMLIYQFEPTTEESFTECEERSAQAAKSPLLGYVFDTTDYSTQISNVTNVISEYMPSLYVGIYDEDELEAQLDKMNKALEAAGIDELIAANQEQLNAWLAENN